MMGGYPPLLFKSLFIICLSFTDRLELKLRKLQKVNLQTALSERKADEARRLLDARLQSSEYLLVVSFRYLRDPYYLGVEMDLIT